MSVRAKALPSRARASTTRRSHDDILKAAAQLLATKGGDAFTIGALVDYTGVARTTIYRHWPTREHLLADALPLLKKPAQFSDDSRTRILKGAAQLLVERGASGFSIDALVARTGIAKTTIYRYWSSRVELLSATIQHLGGATRIPDAGSLRADLIEFFMRPLREIKGKGDGHLPSLPSLIEAAKRDPETLEIGQRMYRTVLDALSPMLERAKARGEIRADRDVEVMTHMLYGAIFAFGGMKGTPTEAFVVEMIDTFLNGVAATPGPSKRASVPPLRSIENSPAARPSRAKPITRGAKRPVKN